MAKQPCDHVPMLVVVILGAFAMVALGGTIMLILNDKPDGSIAIVAGLGGTALGAVAGLLARTSSTPPPQDVTVVNPPTDPVPTTDAHQ